MTERFTIAGSTLSLLKIGEQGVVTRIASLDATIVHQLRCMGVVPGALVTLEQRSPHWIICVGHDQFAVSASTARAIYLRVQPCPVRLSGLKQLHQIAIACLNRFRKSKTHSSKPSFSAANSR
jgi:ferrous iron transport protein A